MQEPESKIPLNETGIAGLDEILGGGLPKNKVVMLVGGPGCGKSVFSMEFILRGIQEFSENGVYCSFEESREDLRINGASFGWDLDALVEEKKLTLCSFEKKAGQEVEVGDFTLEALILRIDMALKAVGARRLVLDGISNLLAGFSNEKAIRIEVIRLFQWLKAQDITVMVTAEQGTDTWARHGFEEYLCDGLIHLGNSVDGYFTTRHLRVIKCRGVNHGTDLYPFLIGKAGIEIMPSRSADFDYQFVGEECLSTGVPDLDEMFAGGGYKKGSTALVTGTSGTGKSSLAASFVNAVCASGGKAVYFSLEESVDQVMANMLSIGIDLSRWVEQGLLRLHASRSTVAGLEGHLMSLRETVRNFEPEAVVVDPITAFRPIAQVNQIKLMLIRLNDFLRSRQITTIMTSLSNGQGQDELSDIPMSSLADTWLSVRIMESNNEKSNILEIHKARGMSHQKQRREITFTSQGLRLDDLYLGPEGLLAGAAKIAQQIRDREEAKLVEDEIRKLERTIEIRKRAMEQKVESMEEEGRTEIIDIQGRISELKKRMKYKDVMTEKVEEALAGELSEKTKGK